MQKQGIVIKGIETTLDCIDGSQYFQGHGHSYSKSDLLACLIFNLPVQRVETNLEVYNLILDEINNNEFYMIDQSDGTINISDKQIADSINVNDLNWIVEGFNDIMDQVEENKREEEEEDTTFDDLDMYLYGWIHIYGEQIAIKQPTIYHYKLGTGSNTLDKILKGEI